MCENAKPDIRSYSKINKDFKNVAQENLKVPSVRLYFGPVERNGFIRHKPQLLHGLLACLRKLKYNVEMIPASHLNVLKVVVLGYGVYRMNLKFLQFNIDCSFDSRCPVIVEQIREAVNRLYNDINIAKEISSWIDDLNQDLSVESDDFSDFDLGSGNSLN